jgi:hypothetical protein
MVPLAALWLPIVVSAVIVFVASSIMHMLLPYHKSANFPTRTKPSPHCARPLSSAASMSFLSAPTRT